VPPAKPADSLVSRSSVVGAPGEALMVTLGWSAWYSAASFSSSSWASAVYPVHQVIDTFALGS
jgi:hypothetical protein